VFVEFSIWQCHPQKEDLRFQKSFNEKSNLPQTAGKTTASFVVMAPPQSGKVGQENFQIAPQ